MEYELAKKLKDAGYVTKNNTCSEPLTSHSSICNKCEGDYLSITLSELIEACGEGLRMLLLHTQYKKKLEKPWEAVPNRKLFPKCKSFKGTTPEEATAKLCINLLELKK